jgi:Icc-related predicted phosphoesterase
VSDTHGRHKRIEEVPDGDVLISAGDFTTRGISRSEIKSFGAWMDKQPHKHKLVIAGNHDFMFERDPRLARNQLKGYDLTYLQDDAVELDGVKFYGSPWQPEFCNWAFNLPRGEALLEKWKQIPDDTDVLITHGPPYGILDEAPDFHNRDAMVNCGCNELAKEIFHRVRPKVHIFGHIHEGYGEHSAEGVRFINASICTAEYQPTNLPIVFDL